MWKGKEEKSLKFSGTHKRRPIQPAKLSFASHIFFSYKEKITRSWVEGDDSTQAAQLMHTSRKEKKKKQQQNVKSSGISVSMGGGRAEASSRRLLLYIGEAQRNRENFNAIIIISKLVKKNTKSLDGSYNHIVCLACTTTFDARSFAFTLTHGAKHKH